MFIAINAKAACYVCFENKAFSVSAKSPIFPSKRLISYAI
jgi:hypothetical protein